MKSDILLLADIFENFREEMYKEYSIDAVWYLTFPGMAQDCALRFSQVKLKLLSDKTMYDFFDRGIRGGISQISHRYAKANNKFLKDYNPEEESSWIVDLDAVGLYANAMTQSLPVSDFTWRKSFSQVPKGHDFIVSVDISIPENLKKKFSDYPLCPEHKNNRLICDFTPKKNYIVHKYYYDEILRLGYKIDKVHDIISFNSYPWLKDYILNNQRLRKNAKSDFEKEIFKLANNSVYGRQLMRVQNHVNVKMTRDPEDFVNEVSKSTFKNSVNISSDKDPIYITENKKVSCTLNQPLYGGQAILDFSKTIMTKFFYDYIQPKFGPEKVKLLATDTDSFYLQVFTEDFFKDISPDVEKWFDTSNFPQDYRLPDFAGKNKKQLGCFASEVADLQITRFCGLRSKMYAVELENKTEKKKCKGVTKLALKDITIEDYINHLDLEREPLIKEVKHIRSRKHINYTEKVQKIVLDGYDSKRKILEDGVSTVPISE